MKPVKLLVVLLVVAGFLALVALFNRSSTPDHPDSGAADTQAQRVRPQEDPVKDTKTPRPAMTGEVAKAELRTNGQYESLGEALAAARHAVEQIDPAGPHSRGAEFFAANPGQQLRAWFSSDGVELASGIPTPGDDEPWNLKLRLVGVGRGNYIIPVAPGSATGEGSRVEIEHHGTPIIQWFENRKDGLEQGFTIEEPPGGQSDEVIVVLKPEGSLRVEAMEEQDGVRFVDANGADVIHYTGLKAWDAAGSTLDVRMELRGGDTFALVVADAEARYPVTVDPMFANVEARLVERSIAGDVFGAAVALAGDLALVGAPSADTAAGPDAGSAYVFARNGEGWSEQAQLNPADAAANDWFGSSVALTNSHALIGAPGDDTPAGQSAGSAYAFVRSSTSWSEQSTLYAGDDAAAWDQFGASLAISGDTVLVGADSSAFVFVHAGGAWSEQARLTGADPAFGWSLAIFGDTALIGAHESAYAFVRSAGSWSQQARLTGSDVGFGKSVALEDNIAVVGAPGPSSTQAGRAYVFGRIGSTWSERGRLVGDDEAGDGFGRMLSLSGDSLLVGAFGPELVGSNVVHECHVFVDIGGTWSQQATLSAAAGRFGTALALDGDTALIGALGADTSAGTDAGSAHVFVRGGTIWSEQAQLSAGDAADGDGFGRSVALSGDSALVGTRGDDTAAGANVGCAYVFTRSGMMWSEGVKLTASDSAPGDGFGSAVALAGDTAAIGAQLADTPTESNAGGAYVFVRDGGTWSQRAKLTPSDAAANDWFGSSVALSEESGIVLVGAPLDDTSAGIKAGSAHLFEQDGGTWIPLASLTAMDAAPFDSFGDSVALGPDTVLVGASGAEVDGATYAGKAYVFARNGGYWYPQATLTADSPGPDDYFGSAIALSGTTAVVGAPGRRNSAGVIGGGSAWVFMHDDGSWTPQALLLPDGDGIDWFGLSVALADDTALIGAPGATSAAGDGGAGAVQLFQRSNSLWSRQLTLTAGVDASTDDRFGHSVALSGDTALVGAFEEDTVGVNAGSAYVFLLGDLPEITQQPQSRTVVPGQLVTFSVTATGYDPLRYQWRRDGYLIEGETSPTFDIPSAQLSDEGNYDCVVSNIGGVVTSAPATLTVNNLSQFEQSFPASPVELNGFLIVNTTPPGIGGAGWRFVVDGSEGNSEFLNERQWRAPGIPVGGLPTGSRTIEFRPVPGWATPSPMFVEIVSGALPTIVEAAYFEVPVPGAGAIGIDLNPADAGGAGAWRLLMPALNDSANPWLSSGQSKGDLTPGIYELEFKHVPGWARPEVFLVEIRDGMLSQFVYTYLMLTLNEVVSSSVIPIETVASSENLPYAYVGQIIGEAGFGTGFVVNERVVATAAHVVFDGENLCGNPDLLWLFQRDRGYFEPDGIIPRGYCVLSDYDTFWEPDPGSTPSVDLQARDVAALWFSRDAGAGGFAGFLASNSMPDIQGEGGNEWLLSNADKMLVGYPVDGVTQKRAGRMHATTPGPILFEPAGTAQTPHLYKAAAIQGLRGISGGPLCVQYERPDSEPSYYPAAVFIGGIEQAATFRAIDGEVVELFNRAKGESDGGDNAVGGGATLTVSPLAGAAENDPGALRVVIEPPEARNLGAAWRLSTETAFARPSGQELLGLAQGLRTVQFVDIPDFVPPAPQEVAILGGHLSTLTFTYASFKDDDDSDGFTNQEELIAGTNPNDPSDYLQAQTISRTASAFSVTVDGRVGRSYMLEISSDPATALWTVVETKASLLADSTFTLTDSSPPSDRAFYRIRVTKP